MNPMYEQTGEFLEDVLNKFRNFLCHSWPDLEFFIETDEDYEFLDDWAQANWELLVERSLSPVGGQFFLSIYRNGSSSVLNTSRVFSPEATANSAIYCLPRVGSTFRDLLSGENISVDFPGLQMSHFVAWDDGYFVDKPPFDCILTDDERYEPHQRVLRFADVKFVIAPYSGD